MKRLRVVSRVIVGLTFMFSGFVKGVDPLGTTYKIEDYFIAYGMDWMLQAALPLAFLLVVIEFAIGAFILFNIRTRITSYALLAMMVFFTGVTFYDALYNPVPDCGCFGEAIKLTNWETFYKNIVLMVFTLVIVFTNRRVKYRSGSPGKDILGVIIILGFLGFSWYSYRHLPPVDFRDWKEGKNMKQTGEARYYLIYKNKSSGKEEKYLSSELPWNDSIWMKEWEFVKQKIDYSSVVKPHELQVMALDGTDMTREIIENDYYQFLVVSSDLQRANDSGLAKIILAYKELGDDRYDFAVLTASLEQEIDAFLKEYQTDMPVYQADDIELKSMVRANPGIILLKEGTIKEKWHYRDFPGPKEIQKKYQPDK